MTPEQFAYWLQGFAEIHNSAPTTQEWTIIKDHLATVFKKITPDRQPYPLGPGVAEPYRGPVNPMINPIGPYVTPAPWVTSPTWPGTKPEIICSASVNDAGGMGFSGIKIEDLK